MPLLKDEIANNYVAYGSIYTHDNVTAQTIPNGTTYQKVTNFSGNGVNHNTTPDYTNNQITVLKDGFYSIDSSFSFTSSINLVSVIQALFINGVEYSPIHFRRKMGTAGDYGASSMSGQVELSAGDVLDCRVYHTNGTPVDLTYVFMNFNVTKIARV